MVYKIIAVVLVVASIGLTALLTSGGTPNQVVNPVVAPADSSFQGLSIN